MSASVALPPPRSLARPGRPSTAARRFATVADVGVPVVVAVVTFAVCLVVAVLRYLTYHAWAYDLGYFAQVVDRTAAGHPFQTTFAPYSFLGQHWEPVLLVAALPARIIPAPLLLLGIQSLGLALAPIAAWRLARAWVGDRAVAAAACLATALSPLVASAAAYDFHTEAVTPALALFALDASARGHGRRFVLLAGALLLVKEDAMLVAAGVGWIAWRADRRRSGLAVAAAGMAAFAVTVGVVMPALRGGRPTDLAARYAYFGSSPATALLGLPTHPGAAVGHLLGLDARRGALRAVGPLAFLPLLSGSALLGVLPVLGVALLSGDSNQASLDLQYGLEVLPLVVACAILGMRWVVGGSGGAERRSSRSSDRGDGVAQPRRSRTPVAIAAALVTAAVLSYVLSARLPGGRAFDRDSVSGIDRRHAVESVLDRVPSTASVSASAGLVPHLANRPEIYQYPDQSGAGAAFVAIDDLAESRDPGPADDGALIAHLIATGHHLVAAAGGVSLWAR